jgi:hypothetical protein
MSTPEPPRLGVLHTANQRRNPRTGQAALAQSARLIYSCHAGPRPARFEVIQP